MRLEDYRKLRGLTGSEAAEELEVDQATYWRWEVGKATPTTANIRKIREWSKGAVTADDLVGEGAKS